MPVEVLNYYVWLECQKHVEYRLNTLYLFAAEGMDQALVMAPPDFFITRKGEGPLSLEELFTWAGDWIGLS